MPYNQNSARESDAPIPGEDMEIMRTVASEKWLEMNLPAGILKLFLAGDITILAQQQDYPFVLGWLQLQGMRWQDGDNRVSINDTLALSPVKVYIKYSPETERVDWSPLNSCLQYVEASRFLRRAQPPEDSLFSSVGNYVVGQDMLSSDIFQREEDDLVLSPGEMKEFRKGEFMMCMHRYCGHYASMLAPLEDAGLVWGRAGVGVGSADTFLGNPERVILYCVDGQLYWRYACMSTDDIPVYNLTFYANTPSNLLMPIPAGGFKLNTLHDMRRMLTIF